MKQAAVGGGIAVVVLCAVGLGYLLMSGPTSNDPPAPTASADGHEAAAPATTTPDPEDDRGSAPPPTAHMPQARVERRLQVNKAERPQLDPDDPRVGLKDPEKWKEHRKQRNRQWRDDQLAIASSWVSSSSLSPEQGQEVLDILNRAHDILESTRDDIEAGVINPSVGREEMNFAKEEVRLEVVNLLGEESGGDFLDAIAKAQGGGF